MKVGFWFLVSLPNRVVKRFLMSLNRHRFFKCGKSVIFNPSDTFSYSTISIGSDVFIGSGATFCASKSAIIVGSKVMFGPNVTIMGGDHNTSTIGSYMFDVKEKLKNNDLPVVIEDDVWVGCNVVILKGVTIGRGAVIAAGSVVIKSVKPYSIVGGVPAKEVSQRFSSEEIIEHEKLLGLQ